MSPYICPESACKSKEFKNFDDLFKHYYFHIDFDKFVRKNTKLDIMKPIYNNTRPEKPKENSKNTKLKPIPNNRAEKPKENTNIKG